VAKKEPQLTELEAALSKVFSDTWPISANFREKIKPVVLPLLEQIEKLKRENSQAHLAMFNILGEAKGQDWSDEPTEAMIAELKAWVVKFHEMKKRLEDRHHV
jgi:hypothetical protein